MKQPRAVTRSKHASPPKRRGLLKTEAMLSMVVLLAAMNFALPMISRINRLSSDTLTHRFAIDELSNQLEQLVRLPDAEVEQALQDICPSEAFSKAAPGCKLAGELSEDSLGRRVTLSLSWIDVTDAEPIRLSGWLLSRDSNSTSTLDSEGDADRGGER